MTKEEIKESLFIYTNEALMNDINKGFYPK